jgi:hypothetical protein
MSVKKAAVLSERSYTNHADNSFPPDGARAGCRVGARQSAVPPQQLRAMTAIVH